MSDGGPGKVRGVIGVIFLKVCFLIVIGEGRHESHEWSPGFITGV